MKAKRGLTTGCLSVGLMLAVWGFAPTAAADCACMCVDEVAYQVCTGIVSTQAVTDECTAQLECPSVPAGSEDAAAEPPVEPPVTADNQGLDCRKRNVYRPDLGHYKAYKVCMPAGAAEAHERRRAQRAAFAAQFADRSDDHRGHDRHHGHDRQCNDRDGGWNKHGRGRD